ncbi:MAG TPA: inositol monophosphatase family protein [Candidatus Kapabacteria bacterium]|nr:inositol monophosphatase family protein [Candidatus Kapabacteria bacterium]
MEYLKLILGLLESAKSAALIAGDILLEGFGTNFKISNKEGRNNLVTEYDLKSERAIIEFLLHKYPTHSFLAEESGNTQNDEIVKWIIDPLDGTTNFANNLPIFSVSIAAEYKGEIVAGVVYNPVLKELFYASKGGGAFLNDNRIYCSNSNDLNTSFLVTGFPYNVEKNPYSCVDTFVKVVLQGIPVRRLGSAAIDLAYVACGRFDGFWELNLNAWDTAAGYLLVEESGGIVTQYNNDKFSIYNNTIIATNGKIHSQVVELINSFS